MDKAQQTPRERMVYEAAQALREEGIGGAALRTVAARADAPRGSLQHYFPGGKDQLVTEAIAWSGAFAAEQVRAYLRDTRRPTPSGLFDDLVHQWSAELEARQFARGCPVAASVVDASRVNPPGAGGGCGCARRLAGTSAVRPAIHGGAAGSGRRPCHADARCVGGGPGPGPRRARHAGAPGGGQGARAGAGRSPAVRRVRTALAVRPAPRRCRGLQRQPCARPTPSPRPMPWVAVDLPDRALPLLVRAGDGVVLVATRTGERASMYRLDGPGAGSPAPVRLAPHSVYAPGARWVDLATDGTRVLAWVAPRAGAHGLPRWTVWDGTPERLVEQPQPFETFGGPRSGGLAAVGLGRSAVLAGTWDDGGPGLDARLWTDPSPQAWERLPADTALASTSRLLPQPTAVAWSSTRLLLAGS